ncbi:hypothetical protein L2bCS78408_02195 [Chlamydia trachomatis]|nr:hypothetical protein L2bCS78408_02195 [Chlamydia trachomatis]AKC31296.1 hypothetical protein L2bCS1908_02195 [Chlamydia trachomatis]
MISVNAHTKKEAFFSTSKRFRLNVLLFLNNKKNTFFLFVYNDLDKKNGIFLKTFMLLLYRR